MVRRNDTLVNLAGVTATDARAGSVVDFGTLDGVHVLVVMRHRH